MVNDSIEDLENVSKSRSRQQIFCKIKCIPTMLLKLIRVFILSRIDNCNPRLSGCSKYLICKLQKFKMIVTASSVVLPGLTTYLRSSSSV